MVGSRARHTAAEQLAVPVDVFSSEDIAQQGTNETSQILQALAPSVNFPRQSVTDANDIARPFTLRGLSPDHTLVLVNGWRRHQMAVLNTFAYGMGAGSSGVDLNALPGGAIDRIEVLRDGASAQYGSDAIAGVVNVVLKEGGFSPFINADVGQYNSSGYPVDGTTADLNGGWGVQLGRGSLAVFGEYLHRDKTNRAWPDIFLADVSGITDRIDTLTGRIIQKRNALHQPNYHWGDGLEEELPDAAEPGRHERGLRVRRLQPSDGHGERLLALLRQQQELDRVLPAGVPAAIPPRRRGLLRCRGIPRERQRLVARYRRLVRWQPVRLQLGAYQQSVAWPLPRDGVCARTGPHPRDGGRSRHSE